VEALARLHASLVRNGVGVACSWNGHSVNRALSAPVNPTRVSACREWPTRFQTHT